MRGLKTFNRCSILSINTEASNNLACLISISTSEECKASTCSNTLEAYNKALLHSLTKLIAIFNKIDSHIAVLASASKLIQSLSGSLHIALMFAQFFLIMLINALFKLKKTISKMSKLCVNLSLFILYWVASSKTISGTSLLQNVSRLLTSGITMPLTTLYLSQIKYRHKEGEDWPQKNIASIGTYACADMIFTTISLHC